MHRSQFFFIMFQMKKRDSDAIGCKLKCYITCIISIRPDPSVLSSLGCEDTLLHTLYSLNSTHKSLLRATCSKCSMQREVNHSEEIVRSEPTIYSMIGLACQPHECRLSIMMIIFIFIMLGVTYSIHK